MEECEISRTDEQNYSIAGVLNFDTVPEILKKSDTLIPSSKDISIDLGQVSDANSAGMALLIEWKSLALSKGYDVTFLNIPVQISRLAEVCKIEKLIS